MGRGMGGGSRGVIEGSWCSLLSSLSMGRKVCGPGGFEACYQSSWIKVAFDVYIIRVDRAEHEVFRIVLRLYGRESFVESHSFRSTRNDGQDYV